MTTNVGRLEAELKLDASKFQAGIASAQAALGTFQTRMVAFQASASKLGMAMTLGITVPVVALGGAMLKMAADAIESENLFEVSMKGMATVARDWSEEVSEALGLNAYEVRRQVGTWNVMLRSMGANEEAAYGMSKGLTMLAQDIASFYNMRPEEAFLKLQSAISGEVEPMRRLGINLTETAVRAFALEKGIIATDRELTESEKIIARYGLLLERTSDAQGDLARTMESPLNTMRRLQSQTTALMVSIGYELMPVASAVLTWLADTGFPNLQDAVGDAKLAWDNMGETGQRVVIALSTLFVAGGPLLKGISMVISGVKNIALAFGLLRAAAVPEILAIGVGLELLGRLTAKAFAALGSAYTETEHGLELMGEQTDANATAIRAWAAQYSPLGSIAGATIGKMFDQLGTFGAASEDANDIVANMQETYAELMAGIYGFTPALDMFKKGMDGAAEKTKKAKDAFAEAGFSAQDMAQAMVSAHPAVRMLELRIVGLKDQLAGVNAAIEGNAAAQQAMQEAIRATQERISELNNQLSVAKQRLSDLANPRLTGMGTLDQQIFDAEQAIKRLQLVAAGGKLPAGIALPKGTIEEWQKLLERLRLQREVTYEPMLRQLQAAAQPPVTEIGFGAAMAAITATKASIASLEGQLVSATAALRGQEDALRGLQREQDVLRESAAQLGKQIAMAEEQLDKATTVLLKIFFDFSDTHSATTIGDVNAAVAAWEAAKNRIDELAGQIWVQASSIGAPSIPTFQHGGIVTRPTLALIGESGPEAVIPLSGSHGGLMSGQMRIEIPVYLDGEVLTRVVWDGLKNRARIGTAMGLS